jgi:hypothetical protein
MARSGLLSDGKDPGKTYYESLTFADNSSACNHSATQALQRDEDTHPPQHSMICTRVFRPWKEVSMAKLIDILHPNAHV